MLLPLPSPLLLFRGLWMVVLCRISIECWILCSDCVFVEAQSACSVCESRAVWMCVACRAHFTVDDGGEEDEALEWLKESLSSHGIGIWTVRRQPTNIHEKCQRQTDRRSIAVLACTHRTHVRTHSWRVSHTSYELFINRTWRMINIE